MTQQELLSEFDATVALLRATLKAKNDDYAQASELGDPFANFSAVETLGLCSAETGFLTRLLDKWQRLKTLAQTGKLSVAGESGLDACLDIMGYAFLLKAYLASKAPARPVAPAEPSPAPAQPSEAAKPEDEATRFKPGDRVKHFSQFSGTWYCGTYVKYDAVESPEYPHNILVDGIDTTGKYKHGELELVNA